LLGGGLPTEAATIAAYEARGALEVTPASTVARNTVMRLERSLREEACQFRSPLRADYQSCRPHLGVQLRLRRLSGVRRLAKDVALYRDVRSASKISVDPEGSTVWRESLGIVGSGIGDPASDEIAKVAWDHCGGLAPAA